MSPAPESVPCPVCATPCRIQDAGSEGLWVCCSSAHCWCGDHFEYYQAQTHVADVTTALGVLQSRGIAGAGAANRDVVIRSYQKHLRTRKRFRDLEDTARTPRGHLSVGDAATLCGVGAFPHQPPNWWHFGPSELDALLGADPIPAHLECRRLGSLHESVGDSAIVVPMYDHLDRVTAVWAAARNDSRATVLRPAWYSRRMPDTPIGVGFLRTAMGTVRIWGQSGLVVRDPTIALQLAADALRHGHRPPPVVVVPPGDAADPRYLSALLAGRTWVVAAPPRLDAANAKLFRLARNLRARVGILPPDAGSLSWRIDNAADNIIAAAGHWGERLANLLSRQPVGSLLAGFLYSFGWTDEIAAEVEPYWPVELCARVRDAVQGVFQPVSIPLGRRFTVADTPEGWVWLEKSWLVAEAIPTTIEAYLDASGRTRHRGTIRFRGQFYAYDAENFRENTAAIIESTLLTAGAVGVVDFHPRIVDRILSIAREFIRLRHRGTL